MITTLEKPRVTEIYVRMDCHGCVKWIKKAVHGLNARRQGYKKARKVATICTHTEFVEAKPETEPPPADTGSPVTDGEPKPADAAPAAPEPANPPPLADHALAPSTESTPESAPPPEPEKLASEAEPTTSESPAAPVTKEVIEDFQHRLYNSREYGYGGPWHLYHGKCGTP